MIIRFNDFRTVENYGKEIYTTESPEDARQFMRENERKMRFLVGGGIRKGDEQMEIYWDVFNR